MKESIRVIAKQLQGTMQELKDWEDKEARHEAELKRCREGISYRKEKIKEFEKALELLKVIENLPNHGHCSCEEPPQEGATTWKNP